MAMRSRQSDCFVDLSISNGQNRNVDNGRDLWRPYLDELEKLPFVTKARVVAHSKRNAPANTDAVVELTTPSGPARLPAELKRSHLSRELAEHLVSVGHQNPGLLVLAPSVGSTVGELFERESINFMDLAGNCHVRVSERYVARIQGKRALQREPADRSLRSPALAVLFALVADPTLVEATTRKLARFAGGVSPQTAADLRAKLVASGIVLETKRGPRWSPDGRKHALDMFLAAYPQLVSGFRIGRFRARQQNLEKLEAELGPRLDAIGEWRWGGGAAAQRLTGYYRGELTTVYLREGSASVASRLQLISDASGPVVLMRSMGPLVLEAPDPTVVNPLIIYADLLLEAHSRARDAAGEIFRRYVQNPDSNP
jgi:hypothetical protein